MESAIRLLFAHNAVCVIVDSIQLNYDRELKFKQFGKVSNQFGL